MGIVVGFLACPYCVPMCLIVGFFVLPQPFWVFWWHSLLPCCGFQQRLCNVLVPLVALNQPDDFRDVAPSSVRAFHLNHQRDSVSNLAPDGADRETHTRLEDAGFES